MRTYPIDNYGKEELERLKAEPWMIQLLKCNPDYTCWGNYEDYMIKDGNGWDTRVEIESVADLWKLDELNEVVNFYFEICRESHKCECCDGSGLNPETKKISDGWYEFLSDGNGWRKSITQDEVDALWEHGRLHFHFDKKPTAKQVNAMEIEKYVHDEINHSICVETRAKRLGVYGHCKKCGGHGHIFVEDKAHLELQLWVLHPRKGCSRGLRVKNVSKSDIPKVIEYLQEARKRNDDRFAKLDKVNLEEE